MMILAKLVNVAMDFSHADAFLCLSFKRGVALKLRTTTAALWDKHVITTQWV